MTQKEFPQLLIQLEQRLKQPLPQKEALKRIFPITDERMGIAPADVKLSAVMILLYIHKEEWNILAIRRTEDKSIHSGQIAFPGGRQEIYDESLLKTALRETFEEIGIQESKIKTIGGLSPVYIPVSNYKVFPYLGFIDSIEHLTLSELEVKEIVEIPIARLISEEAKVEAEVHAPLQPKSKRIVNAYQLEDNSIIWGATAIMLSELELLIRT